MPRVSDMAPPSWHPSPRAPVLRLPRGACDTHVHVFGPVARFPFAADRTFTPANAPKEQLFALHAKLGIERCTIVQSSCHGFDNSAVADALAAKGGAYRGIALAPVDADDATLARLDAAGFRGVRFNYMGHLGTATPIDAVIGMTRRLAAIGWHLQVHFDSRLIDDLGQHLLRSHVPVVIDHMARVDASLGPEGAAFVALMRLLEHDHVWVKVSAVDRSSPLGPPYADAVALARRLVAAYPDRVLWGTDWPHPNARGDPDYGEQFDLIAEMAPTAALRQALLVDNPQRLYRFAPLSP